MTGFLNKAQSPGPIRPGVPNHPHTIHHTNTSQAFPGLEREEKKDKDLGVLQSVVGSGFYLSCL